MARLRRFNLKATHESGQPRLETRFIKSGFPGQWLARRRPQQRRVKLRPIPSQMEQRPSPGRMRQQIDQRQQPQAE